jgi:rhodanese-related sulfurtransferase
MSDPADVTPLQATELVASGALLLDVRELDEWQTLHSPDAVHIPLGELSTRLESLPDDRTILCVCHVGGRSAVAATALRTVGLDARNVTGGMAEWVKAGLPVVDGDGRALAG